MNEEPDMTEQIVGGNVFEFSTEKLHLKDGGESLVWSIHCLRDITAVCSYVATHILQR